MRPEYIEKGIVVGFLLNAECRAPNALDSEASVTKLYLHVYDRTVVYALANMSSEIDIL